MTLMLIIIMTSVIALSVLVNLTMLKTYYTVKEKKTIKESYVQLQKIFKKDTVRENEVDEIAKKYNYRIMISNSTGSRAYSSEGQNSVMYKGLWNIMNNNLDKISDEINKQGYAIMTNSNKSMGTSINLIGYLDGDFTVIISTPMESIQTSARLSGQFTMYVGLILIICGAIAMYLYSRQFTKPIEDMAKAANQMSHLDFDMKVPTGSDDELGRLGNSINELSSKLELTISELKTANNELQKDIEQKVQIDEMRKEFLSNVSHELKTPLALIQGYSEGLKECINDDAQSRDFYCDVIMDEADKMNKMVKKLLTLNQLEFGNDTVEMARFDITELIDGVLQSSSIMAAQKQVNISFYHDGPVYVWGDEFKVEEVITNYLTNAMNHADGERRIEIRFSYHDNLVRTSVFNTGEPIPKEDLEKIWVKFYKVDKARTREYGGSGIGLSIVKAIMDSFHQKCGVINHEDGVEFWMELESQG